MPLVDRRQFDEAPAMSIVESSPHSTMMGQEVCLMLTSFAGLAGDVLDAPPLLDNSLNSQGSGIEYPNWVIFVEMDYKLGKIRASPGISDGSRCYFSRLHAC